MNANLIAVYTTRTGEPRVLVGTSFAWLNHLWLKGRIGPFVVAPTWGQVWKRAVRLALRGKLPQVLADHAESCVMLEAGLPLPLGSDPFGDVLCSPLMRGLTPASVTLSPLSPTCCTPQPTT